MDEIISRIVASVVVMMLAAIVMLAGLGFLFAALYLSLLRYLDPAAAALAVGMAAFLLALVLMLIARRSSRASSRAARRPPRRSQSAPGVYPGEVEAGAVELGFRLADEGQRMVRSHAKGAAAIALATGLVLGLSPRLRRTIWRFMQ